MNNDSNPNAKDAIEIWFHVYDDKARTSPHATVRIPITGMTREEALKVLELIQRSPHVGSGAVQLKNGGHI